jgi:hypothetical protein
METIAKTIRGIVGELQAALNGDQLAGLPNLGNRQVPFPAARVRGDAGGRLIWPAAPWDEVTTLVLLPDGSLAVAVCKTGKTGQMVPRIETRAVEDNDLIFKDVIDLWRTLCIVLPKHIVKTNGGNTRLRELLTRALEVIDPADAMVG